MFYSEMFLFKCNHCLGRERTENPCRGRFVMVTVPVNVDCYVNCIRGFFYSGYHSNSIGNMHYFSCLQVVLTAEGSNFLSYSQIHFGTFYGNLDFVFTFL